MQQQMRFQLSASHKPHIPLPISLLPRDVRRSCIWKNTSPVCKKVCEMHNHHRSLRLIIQYIFFSHCLFPVKAASHLSGWQTSTLYTFCTAWLAKIAICIYLLYIWNHPACKTLIRLYQYWLKFASWKRFNEDVYKLHMDIWVS